MIHHTAPPGTWKSKRIIGFSYSKPDLGCHGVSVLHPCSGGKGTELFCLTYHQKQITNTVHCTPIATVMIFNFNHFSNPSPFCGCQAPLEARQREPPPGPTDTKLHLVKDHSRLWHSKLPHVYIYIHTLHYITLHYITVQYSTVQYSTVHDMTLHYITVHDITLQYMTLHYMTLHYMTLHYITSYIHSFVHSFAHMINIYIYNTYACIEYV